MRPLGGMSGRRLIQSRALLGQIAPLKKSGIEITGVWSTRVIYLDAGILRTTVDCLVGSGVNHGEDIAHVVVGVNGGKPLKSSCRPHLREAH